jgi:hypothetical protein
MICRQQRQAEDQRGSAAVVALVAVTVLVGLSGVVLMTASQSGAEQRNVADLHQASAVAQAGMTRALQRIEAGDTEDLGSEDAPIDFGGGSYWVDVQVDEDSGSCLVVARGTARGDVEVLEAMLTGGGEDVYDHALFAGNSGGDPTYQLTLGGSGSQADLVNGDVYSGGGVTVSGTASVTGEIHADGTITGASGVEGISQPIPDIAAMDYANTADFMVSDLFAGATYQTNSLGGKAWQMPESSPAHIFRKDPNDRLTDINSTSKSDYFLEDPYEPVQADSGSTGANACPITLSGVAGEPGTSGNHKVYYIDGNLWIHNKKTMSFKINQSDASGIQVTFVVKGNIYFSDNVFYKNTQTDGLAFIAMKDEAVTDSGNIYFGDPSFGTLEQMHAFMYAENNFVDKNLSATGSAVVTVYGNMTAGNKVDIQRDYDGQHSKLTINYDGRVAGGDLLMPGLPTVDATGSGAWTFQAMRRGAKP